IFGMTSEQVAERQRSGFAGREAVERSTLLAEAIESIASGEFSPDEPKRYSELVDALLGYDHFMVAADFDSYWQAQRLVDAAWQDSERWMRSSILNVARTGWFSSDRTIREYASEIWNIGL